MTPHRGHCSGDAAEKYVRMDSKAEYQRTSTTTGGGLLSPFSYPSPFLL